MKNIAKIVLAVAATAAVTSLGVYGYRRFKARASIAKSAPEAVSADNAVVEEVVEVESVSVTEAASVVLDEGVAETATERHAGEVRVRKTYPLPHAEQAEGRGERENSRHSWRVLTSSFTRYVKMIRQDRWIDRPGYRTVLTEMPNGAVTVQIFAVDQVSGQSLGELVGITRHAGKMYSRLNGGEMQGDQDSIVDAMLKIEYIQHE